MVGDRRSPTARSVLIAPVTNRWKRHDHTDGRGSQECTLTRDTYSLFDQSYHFICTNCLSASPRFIYSVFLPADVTETQLVSELMRLVCMYTVTVQRLFSTSSTLITYSCTYQTEFISKCEISYSVEEYFGWLNCVSLCCRLPEALSEICNVRSVRRMWSDTDRK